jgi:benzoylsuccinyl-CoA thiolase BbsA subunit
MSVSSDTGAQATRPIWDGLFGNDDQGPYLLGGRCTKCGFITLGVRDPCPSCWSRNVMVPVPIGRTGRVYTRTVIHQAPEGYATPFAVGYIDLDDGVRVFAHLANDEQSLRIDGPVRLTLAPLRQAAGGWLLGPRYVAATS